MYTCLSAEAFEVALFDGPLTPLPPPQAVTTKASAMRIVGRNAIANFLPGRMGFPSFSCLCEELQKSVIAEESVGTMQGPASARPSAHTTTRRATTESRGNR